MPSSDSSQTSAIYWPQISVAAEAVVGKAFHGALRRASFIIGAEAFDTMLSIFIFIAPLQYLHTISLTRNTTNSIIYRVDIGV